MWGTWNGKVKSTGEIVNVSVHIASQQDGGKTVVEYGFWDLSVVGPILKAAGDM